MLMNVSGKIASYIFVIFLALMFNSLCSAQEYTQEIITFKITGQPGVTGNQINEGITLGEFINGLTKLKLATNISYKIEHNKFITQFLVENPFDKTSVTYKLLFDLDGSGNKAIIDTYYTKDGKAGDFRPPQFGKADLDPILINYISAIRAAVRSGKYNINSNLANVR